ncbi:MAG: hypothetical protein JWR67_2248 [Mucilaginibacter sp.]|nr:hypothetical protein [Mucilaginibacter sp.]
MLKINELYIYPVKSLGGIKVNKAYVTDRGLEYDRRWMLVDKYNRFISQREVAQMALLKVNFHYEGLQITDKTSNANLIIPFQPLTQQFINVTIWDDTCTGQLVSEDADKWFTEILGINCRLVYMPDETVRSTDPKYTSTDSITSFSDAYPFLIIGQASLDDLNDRLPQPLLIDRFRPNIVFTGGKPYQEDTMDTLVINNITFNGVKLCARCNVITIDQSNAVQTKEPLKTLATYRSKNNKVYFGQNLISLNVGYISVNDQIAVLNTHTAERFMI